MFKGIKHNVIRFVTPIALSSKREICDTGLPVLAVIILRLEE